MSHFFHFRFWVYPPNAHEHTHTHTHTHTQTLCSFALICHVCPAINYFHILVRFFYHQSLQKKKLVKIQLLHRQGHLNVKLKMLCLNMKTIH
jgi:hypothetical protein